MNNSPQGGYARRNLVILVSAICSFLASHQAVAQTATATLTGPGAIDLRSGGSFTLDLRIMTNFDSSGITFFFEVSPNGSGLFRITGRNTAGSPYPDPTSSDAQITSSPGNVLNPVNDFDLGATNNGSDIDPAGDYFIASITIQVPMGIPLGPYNIFLG